MISIDEKIYVPSSASTVWGFLSDPEAVVSCIPGASLGEQFEDGSFSGSVPVKFGPLRVSFGARISLELDEPVMQGTISAKGKDGNGGTRFTASASFSVLGDEEGNPSTILMIGEINLTGKLASVAEASATTVVGRMTKEFTDNFAALCTQQGAPVGDDVTESRSSHSAHFGWRRILDWIRGRRTVRQA
jgi:carbon monoxide dehydrogenase subunit G